MAEKKTTELTPREMMELMTQGQGRRSPATRLGAGLSGLASGWTDPAGTFKTLMAGQKGTTTSPMDAMAMMMISQQMDKSGAGKEESTDAPILPENIPGLTDATEPGLVMKPSGTAFSPVDTAKLAVSKEQASGKVKALNKWNEESVQRQIKFDVMTPKMNNYMEVGGRAYQELSDWAKGFGVKLDFSKGGLDAYVAQVVKKAGGIAKMTPLMKALDALRPELGVELMRQLGAFRSAQMASKFENTLSKFSGNIREDIALMTTTLTKNKANVVLLDEAGNPLPDDMRNKKMDSFEADLIRKYNFMYRGMGLMDKPYTAQRSFDWLAKNSSFNPKEQALIDNATKDNPKAKREKVIAKLIEKGLL